MFCNDLTGRTTSDNFVTTDNVIQEESTTDSGDVFITKLAPNGSLAFSTLFGGDGDDSGRAITVDSNNNILFARQSGSWLLPVTNANFSQSVYGGSKDSYLAIITLDGKELLFMTYIGGTGTEFGWGIIMTSSDEVLVAGNTNAHNFPIVNVYQSELGGNQDIFICKFNPMQEISSSLEEDKVSNDISGFESGFLISEESSAKNKVEFAQLLKNLMKKEPENEISVPSGLEAIGTPCYDLIKCVACKKCVEICKHEVLSLKLEWNIIKIFDDKSK